MVIDDMYNNDIIVSIILDSDKNVRIAISRDLTNRPIQEIISS